MPTVCPVLGIPLLLSDARTPNSPSLDRILPRVGYVPGNIRVISDRANRLKGDRDQADLQDLAARSSANLRPLYAQTAKYVEREMLLAEVRKKAAAGGRYGEEWLKIERFLNRAFQGDDAVGRIS